jgi:hypothetical protein
MHCGAFVGLSFTFRITRGARDSAYPIAVPKQAEHQMQDGFQALIR